MAILNFERLLSRFGRLVAFLHFRLTKGPSMDPVTAIFNVIATPAGQNVVEDIRKVDAAFVGLIAGLVKKIHDKQA